MWTTNRGTALTVIGENIHATRVVLRTGKYGTTTPDGRPAVRFTDASGVERLLPLPAPVLEGQDFANGRVKQVAAAILLAMDGGPESEVGIAFLRALATRQAAAGADYLDLNVDEVTSDPDGQQAAMRWLVQTIEAVATVPLALDSSSPAVIAAGLAASRRARGAPLLNSASLERLEVLDLAAAQGCPVVVSAAGRTQMPTGAEERVANALAVVEEARSRGIRVGDIYIDPLVLPVGMDPDGRRTLPGRYRPSPPRPRPRDPPDRWLQQRELRAPAAALAQRCLPGSGGRRRSGQRDPRPACHRPASCLRRGSHVPRLAAGGRCAHRPRRVRGCLPGGLPGGASSAAAKHRGRQELRAPREAVLGPASKIPVRAVRRPPGRG